MVYVLGSNLSALECLRIAIADNAFQRPLDLLETSRALYKLATHSHPGSHLNELAASLGLPSNPSVFACCPKKYNAGSWTIPFRCLWQWT